MTVATAPEQDTTYNGWANYETWNVALWMTNDYGLYRFFVGTRDYAHFVRVLDDNAMTHTPDGVAYASPELDIERLDEMFTELSERWV